MNNTTKLETIFKGVRIVSLAGNKHTGKTNNIVHLLKEQLTTTPELQVCVFGFEPEVMTYLKGLGCIEISDIRHMVDKKNTLFILDEMQKLHLNDRRNKDSRDKIVDFIYHNNNLLLLSSPNIREFNSIIGGITERWLLKSINLDQTVNGSQLKEVVKNYKGRYKSLDNIRVEKNELLLINEDCEVVLDCEYVAEADSKKKLSGILSKKLSSPESKEKSEELIIELSV